VEIASTEFYLNRSRNMALFLSQRS